MKIFLSHTSRDKSTVNDFRKQLPSFLDTWLDDESLLWGGSLTSELQSTIQSEVDFLIVFLNKDSLGSDWVQRELGWAFQRECELKRTFVLPILFPETLQKDLPDELSDRFILRLYQHDSAGIEALAKRVSDKLFQLVVKDYTDLKSGILDSGHTPPGLQDVLQGFPDRNRYFEEIMEQVSQAKRQILMCVHTLKPARPGSPIETLHHALGAKAQDLEIKILAPAGENRATASYQLAQYGISVRHLNVLQHLDVSFSIFDSTRAVLPTESGNTEETVAGITVKSAKLAELLRESFDDLWWRFDALSYPIYIRSIVGRVLANTSSLPMQAISDRLEIPQDELTKLLPALRARVKPRYYFVFGRPCSGKSTVARRLIEGFERTGIPRNEIYYFNDYEALYERFVGDLGQRSFKEGERGGFAVHNFAELDIVLKKANCELVAGERFFQIFIVEFARDSYLKALLNFDSNILDLSKVIHVKAALATCLKRNRERDVVMEDHRSGYVPEDIMNEFYANENLDGIREALGLAVEQIDTDSVDLNKLDSLLDDMVGQQSAI